MDERNQGPEEGLEESLAAPDGERETVLEKPEHHSPLEPIYRNIDVPLKYVDIFIVLCIAALILVVVVGILKGNGIL